MSSDSVDGPSVAAIESPSEINDLDEIQDIIDISADRLEGLRTQCATSATLTQQEIRSLESKLVRMFSDLLLKKARLNERIPANGLPHTTSTELKQWLRVVGLSQESVNVCLTRVSTLEQLMEQTDEELKQMLSHNPSFREEEVRRLTKAMLNLRKYIEYLNKGGNGAIGSISDNSAATEEKDSPAENGLVLTEQLFWDSWDRHHMHRGSIGGITSSPRNFRNVNKHGKSSHHSGSSRQSPAHDLSSKSSITSAMNTPDDLSSMQGSNLTLTLTPSPPNSPYSPPSGPSFYSAASGSIGGSLNGTPLRGKFAGTPPPLKKHQTLLHSGQSMTPTHLPSMLSHQLLENSSYTKDKYNDHYYYHQESNLSSPPNALGSGTITSSSTRNLALKGHILQTDPSPDSYSTASSELYIENNNNANNCLHIPRSPGTPVVKVGMTHNVKHRFNKVIKIRSTCDLCQKPMYIGLKCKECKYRCHKDCESNVPPSCGLPPEYVNTFKNLIQPNLQEQINFPTVGGGASHLQMQGSSASVTSNTSPNLNHKGHHSFPRHNKPDSSSPGSSCNSSSPSSPALFNLHHHGSQQSGSSNYAGNTFMMSSNMMSSSGGASSSNSSNHLSTPSSQKQGSQFNFPEVTITSNNGSNITGTQTLYASQTSNSTEEQQESDYNDGTSLVSVKSILSTTSGATQSLASSITISSSNCSSVTLTSSVGGIGSETVRSIGAGSNSITSSLINSTTTATFYQRKLSSAGVDKIPAFNNELSDTHKSNDSDKTVSLSGSTSASTDSDRTPVRLDSTEDGDSGNWPRQNSLSLKEWDIPYNDLTIKEKIGKGRFGTVHRALWHGDVAVKLLKKDYLDDEHMLEAFKLEVANFKKTRHENLVLFMGACMNPPYLAIVTSLCKGNTLYTYVHQRHEKFTINKTTLVAQQISQGMGYLHARGICHKDLRTKNIFLENGKVIITDFGLFSSTKLLYCDIGLGVPNGWLCYLAPELMRALMPVKPTQEILPFSQASDVYSFGTVWYELLCGEFPFRKQPHESIIWQVGRGMKQTLANLQTSRDVKDILMLCWSFTKEDRPNFTKLLKLLERLPKKRLARSPSHPVQLSRSAESVF